MREKSLDVDHVGRLSRAPRGVKAGPVSRR
jgi:hypothetical protein